jgi:hypothetical protein
LKFVRQMDPGLGEKTLMSSIVVVVQNSEHRHFFFQRIQVIWKRNQLKFSGAPRYGCGLRGTPGIPSTSTVE